MSEQIYAASMPTDEEYAAYIGNNVYKFMPLFKRYSLQPATFQAGWNWPAFFFSFWWYLYRKMYFWALAAFITLLIPYFNLVIMIGWGVAANYLYFRHANNKIDECRSVQGPAFMQCLYESGGVNGWVPWVAVVVSCGFFTLAVLGVLSLALIFG